MVVGIIVGAFIFVQPTEVTRLVPNGRGVILAWLVSGILTLCAALVCAELSRMFPETGGVYVFLKRIYSPALAFLWGWGLFWVMHSGIIAAIATILSDCGINLDSVLQKPGHSKFDLPFVTTLEACKYSLVEKALAQISRLDFLVKPCLYLPILD